MSGDKSIKPQPDIQSIAQSRFEKAARAADFVPENKWIGGYFDYEWTHLRPLLGAYDLVPSSGRLLEFGCNVGASSLIMAAMGGNVTGIDVDESMIAMCTRTPRSRARAVAARSIVSVASTVSVARLEAISIGNPFARGSAASGAGRK